MRSKFDYVDALMLGVKSADLIAHRTNVPHDEDTLELAGMSFILGVAVGVRLAMLDKRVAEIIATGIEGGEMEGGSIEIMTRTLAHELKEMT